MLGEGDLRAHLLAQLPFFPSPGEVPHKHPDRKAAVYLDPAVPTGPAASEHLLGDVRRGDLDRETLSGVQQSHSDAVRLLACRAASRPHPYRRGPAGVSEPGRHELPGQGLEGIETTKPRGLVRGQGLDNSIVPGAGRHHAQRVHVLVDPCETSLTNKGLQAVLHQVLLADRQPKAATAAREVRHEPEAARRDAHEPPAAEARSRVTGWTANAIAPPISSSGST